MVALLALAHDRGCEAELAAALDAACAADRLPDLAALTAAFAPREAAPPAVTVHLPAVAAYDALLLAPAGARP